MTPDPRLASRTGPRAERARRAAAVLDAARCAGYGPRTPIAQRDPQMARLAAAGCFHEEIARLFGITRVTVSVRLARLRKAEQPAGDGR